MPVSTRFNTRLVQPTNQVTSPGVHHSPRRILRSRQGNAGVIMNIDAGSPSFIRAVRQISDPFYISRCADMRCKTCPKLNRSSKIKSSVTNKIYEMINHTGENLNCHSQNIIYLLTCSHCSTQYVGETIQKMHERMNCHRTSKVGCEHVINHSKNSCNGHFFEYQILEKFPGNGYDQFGSIDQDMSKTRLKHEEEWILKLRTIYPYGLNEKLSGKVTNSNIDDIAIGKLYPPLPRTGIRPTRTRKADISNLDSTSTDEFFKSLDHILNNNLKQSFHQIRVILNNTKKRVLKDIAFHILNREHYIFHENREQWYIYILDIIDTKFLKSPIDINIKKPPKNICVIEFTNKGMDNLHISSIFKSNDVIDKLPDSLRADTHVPVVTMKLKNTIRNKILNYKDTVKSLIYEKDDDISFISNSYICECEGSQFCDTNHKHIVTGDLSIISNNKLRKLFSKGPNYRENVTINYNNCLKTIKHSLLTTIDTLSNKYDYDKNLFNDWYNTIIEKVKSRIAHIKDKHKPQQAKPTLKDEDALACLRNLHEKFVVVPIDKASNNVAIICKKFYIDKLLQEVGISGSKSDTYLVCEEKISQIVFDNTQYCKKMGLTINDTNKTLPIMYWMPKMHYTPSRARFIVASATCSTKQMSQIVSKIFKKIFEQIKQFHEKSYFYKNYNRFWVIQNSFPIIDKLNQINKKKTAKDISTFDFSTLYTKLPHDDLLKVLHEIIDFVFDGGRNSKSGNRKYLTLFNKECVWTKTKHGYNSFTKSNIKQMVSFLIKECYFTIGNLLFRQCVGIPMGIDPAPFWANLYLYKYESDFISDLIKNDKVKAYRYKHSVRFIDDECNLNDGGEFNRSYQDIYPQVLQLKCEHTGSHANFLDLDITIVDGVFEYKLYDKRDDYPFFIIRMPDLRGNIPSYIFYGSILSEVVRIARCTLKYIDFVPKISDLFSRMKNQGAYMKKLICQMKKAMQRHPLAFESFNMANEIMISNIINYNN